MNLWTPLSVLTVNYLVEVAPLLINQMDVEMEEKCVGGLLALQVPL
jgi:hypothetical protein